MLTSDGNTATAAVATRAPSTLGDSSLMMPLRHSVRVTSFVVQEVNTADKTIAVNFAREGDDQDYTACFKQIDLRQEQLAMNVINLMWTLLLDDDDETGIVKVLSAGDGPLTPVTYEVLPTSSIDGLVETIPSTPINEVLPVGIVAWIVQHGSFTEDEAMRRFVVSLALWTVFTFLLGSMDRNPNNIRITNTGLAFHTGLSTLLGRSSGEQPQQPLMFLNPDIAAAMGRVVTKEFQDICVKIYLALRRHAQIITDVLIVLVHERCGEPELTLTEVSELTEHRFMIGDSDEQAADLLRHQIEISLGQTVPRSPEHLWHGVYKGVEGLYKGAAGLLSGKK